MNNFNEARDAGVQFVYVGPSYKRHGQRNFEARHGCRCCPAPIRPSCWAVCYEMIEQDVVDYDFLNTYCVGFDGDHMPADATLQENFRGSPGGRLRRHPEDGRMGQRHLRNSRRGHPLVRRDRR